jgi:peptidoglycan/xylan/chitin deacetylase (PgdA/CDA1 family)
VRGELTRAEGPWWRLAHAAPVPYFRPPYGALGPAALGAVGAAGYRRTVLWDVDPQDWRRPGAAVIAERAAGPARAGSIVLLHVIAQTADALPAIITRLEGKGLRPVGLDELFRAAGVP